MLFQGQEFGLQTGWDDDNNNGNYDEEKLQYRPVDWSLLETNVGQSHLDHYSTLARLRKSNPAFYNGTFYDLYRYTNEKVIVYGYKDESENNNNNQIVVVANFSTIERTVEDVPFLSSGDWYNVLEPDDIIAVNEDNSFGEYFIAAKSAVVYSNSDLQLNTNKEKITPDEYQTLDCYPNPFNGNLKIQYKIDEVSDVNLKIYGVDGRLVKVFNLDQQTSGQHFFHWDGRNSNGKYLPTGIYIISLKSKNIVTNKKVLYLK